MASYIGESSRGSSHSSGGLSSKPSQIVASSLRYRNGNEHQGYRNLRSSSPSVSRSSSSSNPSSSRTPRSQSRSLTKPRASLKLEREHHQYRNAQTNSSSSGIRQRSTGSFRSPNAADYYDKLVNEGKAVKVTSGDTLSAIAQERLGDASRWRELRKPSGAPFSKAEAESLQIGDRVLLPKGSGNSKQGAPGRFRSPNAADYYDKLVNEGKAVKVTSGDTLSAIAQERLGDASRWRELRKPSGAPFSKAEAESLQIGDQVLLPRSASRYRGMSPDAVERRNPKARQILREVRRQVAYNSLYEREYDRAVQALREKPEDAPTTWNIARKHDHPTGIIPDSSEGAKRMLEQYKDFLMASARRYGVDGHAIAGAIRWEYEQNAASRYQDRYAYNYVQRTGDVSDVPNPRIGFDDPTNTIQARGTGWGKMHFDTAQEVLRTSGETVPDDRTLATMLALSPSAIDLIGKSMQQAVEVYRKERGVDISSKPEILADLYQSSGYYEKYVERAKAREGKPEVGNPMGEWVENNLDSLEEFRTS